jgi:preprotein translocase subunit SecG
MYTLLIGLAIFVAILLVLVVLAQNSKGGGLSSQFGGSGASNLIGVKKTGDLLERLTWGFAIGIMILALATNLTTPNVGGASDDILDRAKETQTAPALNLKKSETAPAEKADSTK